MGKINLFFDIKMHTFLYLYMRITLLYIYHCNMIQRMKDEDTVKDT